MKLIFLSDYKIPVAACINPFVKLIKPSIEVDLIPQATTKPINYGGIHVGVPTQVGEIKVKTFEILNQR